MKTRILLADDHVMIREGLRLLINREDDMDVIGEAEDGREVLRLVPKINPDIIIMDVEMPNLNGSETTRQVVANYPNIDVIALSAHTDCRYIAEMLKAGAKGYLLKHSASDELLQAIHLVSRGKTYLSPEIAGTVTADYRRQVVPSDSPFSKLSSRESEVLQMLSEGKSRKEIASDLCLSIKTVATHVEHIREKLDLHSVAELTKYAIREGVTSVE
jgi:DNA-binding NarL/FixJ family response regulator